MKSCKNCKHYKEEYIDGFGPVHYCLAGMMRDSMFYLYSRGLAECPKFEERDGRG